MPVELAVAIGVPIGGTHTGLGHPLPLLVALHRALALHRHTYARARDSYRSLGTRAGRSRWVFLGLLGGERLDWSYISRLDSNRGDGRALVCGTPCPGHGNARHGVDHGGLHLGLALVRFGPEVLSSSSMGRRFSCSSKNKSRRVSWAVTGRFICSITSTVVTPGNAGDASVAADLIEDLLGDGDETEDDDGAKPKVYGDNAYGTGEFQSKLEHADIASGCKAQSPSAAGGLFTKDRFNIDLGARTVTCPNNVTVPVRYGPDGNGTASFGRSCTNCPLRACCTTAAGGRTIGVGSHEDALAHARDRQKGPEWAADYRATRPKVERKLGHLMRRRHGGRRARVRGRTKVDADFNLLAAATNLARLAVLGLRSTPSGWAVKRA